MHEISRSALVLFQYLNTLPPYIPGILVGDKHAPNIQAGTLEAFRTLRRLRDQW